MGLGLQYVGYGRMKKTTSHNRMRDNILAIWYSANDIERGTRWDPGESF